eukprot:10741833-Karenia_brevis.AAC.1
MAQEVKARSESIDELKKKAGALGWKTVWAPGKVTDKNAMSSGVAICARLGLALWLPKDADT